MAHKLLVSCFEGGQDPGRFLLIMKSARVCSADNNPNFIAMFSKREEGCIKREWPSSNDRT